MLLAIRHGRTSFNEDGTERLRGWLPIPLSAEGQQEAHQTGHFLQQLHLPAASLQSSPMLRAMQSASAIGAALKMPVHAADGLKDWNVGALAGRRVDDTLPLVHRYIQRGDIAPPGGEPYNAFRQRAEGTLRGLIAGPDLHLAVTHSRLLTLLKAMSMKDDAHLLNRGPVEPGGVVLVKPDLSMHVLFKEHEEAGHTPARV